MSILAQPQKQPGLNGKIDAEPKTAETIASRAGAAFRTLDFLYHDRIVDVIIEDHQNSSVVQIRVAGRPECITAWVTMDSYRIEGIKGSAKDAVLKQLDMALNGHPLVHMSVKRTTKPSEPADEDDAFVHKTRPLEFLPRSVSTFDED